MAARVLLDLDSPVFLDDFLSLDKTELARVAQALRKIRAMDWETFVRHPGSRWEEVRHIRAPDGGPVHSFRLSRRYRALAVRDGDCLRVLSLHLDHDSAYSRR